MSLPEITAFNIINTSFHLRVREGANRELWGEIDTEEGVFSGYAKFEVVRALNGVHLRSLFNNKYLTKDASSHYISAKSDEAVEDTTAQNCTLFTVENRGSGSVVLKHVQTGMYLDDSLRQKDQPFRPILNDTSPSILVAVDLKNEVIKLPKKVVIKCFTGEYLLPSLEEIIIVFKYQKFEGTDRNNTITWYITSYDPVGKLRLLPFYYWSQGEYDQFCGVADIKDNLRTPYSFPLPLPSESMYFKVLHTSGNSICLINYQGTFLRKTPEGYYTADASSAVTEAIVQVEEPVIRRNIEIKYRLEDAIIYDLEPLSFAADITENTTNESAVSTLTVEYTKSRTFTFSVSAGVSASVSSTISGGIPLVAEFEVTVEFGASIETSFGVEINETQTVTDSVQVTVPPKSRRGARKVAMKGKCDVPFSYKQVDVLANGERVEYNLSDGVFRGMNGYAFYTLVFDPDNPTVILERIPG